MKRVFSVSAILLHDTTDDPLYSGFTYDVINEALL